MRPPAPAYRFELAAEGLPTDAFWKSTPAVGDVNGDGIPDIAIHPRLQKGARVFLGDGKGGWKDSSQGLAMPNSCGGSISLVDVNKDGKLDIVIADHCEGVYVYLGDGQGKWQEVTHALRAEFAQSDLLKKKAPEGIVGTESVAVGDVNGDGFMDLIVSGSDLGGLTVFLGDGTGRNWKEVNPAGLPNGERAEAIDAYLGGYAFDLHLLDVNGDGRLDLVASYYNGPRVWWGDGTGHFVEHSTGLVRSTLGGFYGRIAIGDLNGDGRPDLVMANNVNGAEAYFQNADGTWRGPVDVMPELKGGAWATAIADLDGDGKMDVVIGGLISDQPNRDNLPHGLWIRWGDGQGGFNARPTTNLPGVGLEIIWGITVADVDRDGRPDLIVSSGGYFGKMGTTQKGALIRTSTGGAERTIPVPNMQVWLNKGPR